MSKLKLAVRAGEEPWTTVESDEVRSDLETDLERLRGEVDRTTAELQNLMRDGIAGAGKDQADIGSNSIERDSGISLVANQRELLEQTQKALERIAVGTYGVCESCAEPIGKMRLMAFPRATLCMTCKQREERR